MCNLPFADLCVLTATRATCALLQSTVLAVEAPERINMIGRLRIVGPSCSISTSTATGAARQQTVDGSCMICAGNSYVCRNGMTAVTPSTMVKTEDIMA